MSVPLAEMFPSGPLCIALWRWAEGAGINTDSLVISIAVTDELPFVSGPGIVYPLPASVNSWPTNLLLCKQGKFQTLHSSQCDHVKQSSSLLPDTQESPHHRAGPQHYQQCQKIRSKQFSALKCGSHSIVNVKDSAT